MSSHWFRRFQKGIAACLVILGALSPLACAADRPEMFYYLAVPSLTSGTNFFLTCIQLDRKGVPVPAKGKSKETPDIPFFSIWRSSSWPENDFSLYLYERQKWERAVESKAKQTIATKKEILLLPPPLVQFFLELEKVRAATACDIIAQPLCKNHRGICWEYVKHLDVLAAPSDLSAEERVKFLVNSLWGSSIDKDPAKWLESHLTNLGVKIQSVRYWPEYNMFLFEADAEFKDMVDTLFNSYAMEPSWMSASPICAMHFSP